MDERARKRKLEELVQAEDSDIDGVEKEQPKQGLKVAQDKKTKKQKVSQNEEGKEGSDSGEVKLSKSAEK